MIDKQNIIKDIESRKYTHGVIATRNNCSIATVRRAAISIDKLPGQGIRNYWEFTKMTKELAYIIGTYLTDGYVRRRDNRIISGIGLSCVDIEFADHFEYCINSIGLKSKRGTIEKFQSLGHQMQHVVFCYSSMFARWIYDVTKAKSRVPDCIFNASKECIVEFVAAIIDGDGSVGKDGSITVSNTQKFIIGFEDLIKSIGIRTFGVRIDSILDSGKIFYRIGVRRADFINVNGKCKISRKQDRIENAKDERTLRRPRRYKYVCPVCGITKMANKNANMCRDCYKNSDELKERLRNQASKAGIAGNKARWG